MKKKYMYFIINAECALPEKVKHALRKKKYLNASVVVAMFE